MATSRPTITYDILESSLGLIAVAETPRGIAAVLLGKNRKELADVVARHVPGAMPGQIRHGAKVIASLETGRDLDVELDPQGTPFQKEVWNALRDIPAGETITYGTLATRIGRPNAVRAVGAACGANPIAIIIPCHRVVGSTGKLTGYAYGLDMKRQLLDRERGETLF
jgi:AraC family transcriptional regulator of adaptative response/methylated-DNA-[protein]-cysteine methyltransferase